MPRNHTGAKSGDTYTIPELTDRRDIEVAFTGFADTLPRSQQAIVSEWILNNKAGVANHLYLYEGATPITVTLPPTANLGDRIIAAQLGAAAGIITVQGTYKGTPVTAGQNTAISTIWDGTGWVGLPFSFSGTRPNPGDSTGGTIVDLNGFRYHIFDMPGEYTFTSSWLTTAPQQVEVLAVGAGQAGTDGTPSIGGQAGVGGVAGNGGQIARGTPMIRDWAFIPVRVGSGGVRNGAAGESSSFDTTTLTAENGSQGPFPEDVLTGDWLTAIRQASAKSRPSSPWTGPAIGGVGGMGPSDPSTYGIGGGAGYAAVPSVVQGTETYSYTTGGPYTYPCNYGASSRQVQTGTTEHRGDYRPVFCPDGWRVSLVDHSFVQCQNIADPSKVAMNGWMGGCPGGWYACGMNCCTQVPTYGTEYYCPSGGSLSGSTCLKDCTGDNTQHHTGTRPKPCGGGTVAQNGWCVDARPLNGGRGGDGLVAIRYPHP